MIYWLLTFHFIFDAALQPDWMLKAKKDNWYVMAEHCAIWTGGITAVLAIYGEFAWWKVVSLFVGHFLIDTWKIKVSPTPLSLGYLLTDQLLHFIQLLLVW